MMMLIVTIMLFFFVGVCLSFIFSPHLCFSKLLRHLSFLLIPKNSAIIVGRDYPSPNGEGLDYVRRKWKEAIRDPANYQGLIAPLLSHSHEDKNKKNNDNITDDIEEENERIIRKAVGRGRYMIREMEATIQFKKYRSMRRRYGEGADVVGDTNRLLGK
jgi:hypothetical protein